MSDDVRLADIIRPGTTGDVVIQGFPCDTGVERNGGRVGARDGPDRFRYWTRRYGTADNPEFGLNFSRLTLTDAGDLACDGTLEEAHNDLTRAVQAVLESGGIPFVIGGGNDQSWPNARALLNHQKESPVGVINIDAHLDVRPLKDGLQAHSGSPFRLLLEDDRFSGEHFIEFAAQGSQCSRDHAQFVEKHGGQILWLSEISKSNAVVSFRSALGRLARQCPALFVSFDLDSIRAADAPGVSCPGTLGLRATEAMEIAFHAGQHPQLCLFDLSEYNPKVEDERTGRLAVSLFYHFCLGVASRKEGKV